MSTETTGIIVTVKHLGYIPALLIGLSLENYSILGAFLVFDYMTGILRAGLVDGPSSIKSYRAVAGLISKSLIFTIPLLLVWAGRGASVDMLPLATRLLGLLVFAQLYSILGNIYSIYIGKNIPEFDAVNFILRKLRDTLETFIKSGSNKV